jgi:hypothetical protein
MFNRPARIAFLVLAPCCVLGGPKEKGTTKVQVVTARTQIHGSSSGNMFSYTNLMFTERPDRRSLPYPGVRANLHRESGRSLHLHSDELARRQKRPRRQIQEGWKLVIVKTPLG